MAFDKVNCSGHPEPRRRVEAPVAILYSRASLVQVPHHAGRHTAYLMELESVYNAMLETGRAAEFVTTRRVLEGALADYALLIVPAATYENEDVYRQIMEFVADGGAALLIPNSFFFDEYASF